MSRSNFRAVRDETCCVPICFGAPLSSRYRKETETLPFWGRIDLVEVCSKAQGDSKFRRARVAARQGEQKMDVTPEQAKDMLEAHDQHHIPPDGVPREGCPECESRKS